jgi:hypothetical protein
LKYVTRPSSFLKASSGVMWVTPWGTSGKWRCGIEATSRRVLGCVMTEKETRCCSSTRDHFRIQTGPLATLDGGALLRS